MDHGFHHLAGALDQVDDGQQDLPVGLAELLDHGGLLASSVSHNMVLFLHGGWLLSDSCLATGFYRNRRHRRLPTSNYDRDTLQVPDSSRSPVELRTQSCPMQDDPEIGGVGAHQPAAGGAAELSRYGRLPSGVMVIVTSQLRSVVR